MKAPGMTIPDSGKDFLDKLDRLESSKNVLPAVLVFADGCATGFIVMKSRSPFSLGQRPLRLTLRVGRQASTSVRPVPD
jgi:hypothetical protein